MSLCYAYATGDVARVRQAVADGVDVRKAIGNEVYNETPLHYSCWYAVYRSLLVKYYTYDTIIIIQDD